MNAAALFRDAAHAHPRRTAFIESGRRVTFEELWERVCRFAGALHERGFGPHNRALVLLPMSVELYVALLAILKEGGIAVFLDPWVGARMMTKLARHAAADAWLGTPKSHLLRLFVRGVAIAPLSLARFANGPFRDAIHDSGDDAPALITFTTGSSGAPKGINRTHRVLIAQHERLAAEFPPREGDVDLCTFPVYALNNLALGVTTVIPPIDLRRVDEADPHRVARAANEAGVTTCAASPPLFDQLAPLAARPRFRRILTGGAPVSDAQLRAWVEAWPDAEIIVAYGSSEAEPVAHVTAEERLQSTERGYLAGRIVEGLRTRIEPLSGAPASRRLNVQAASPAGGGTPRAQPARTPALPIGELLVSGDHVASDSEWHRMGDTGWLDDDGRFHIAGRVHSTMWRNGVPVHAHLVEQAARGDDPRIRRAAALAVGEQIVVVVESDADVETDVRARLAAAGEPCDRVVVQSKPLPVDPRHNSKIDYAALRKTL